LAGGIDYMRIISGKLKGKKIFFLKNINTRPLKDSVKENIFNIIFHSNLLDIRIEDSDVLDLYSGVGSFGLEAFSRGARNVTFIDKNREAIETLKKNITNLGIRINVTLIEDEIANFLKRSTSKFDLIFLDPPFKENSFLNDLENIKKRKIYKKKHFIIIHRERKTQENFDGLLNPILIKYYGRSKIIFGKISN